MRRWACSHLRMRACPVCCTDHKLVAHACCCARVAARPTGQRCNVAMHCCLRRLQAAARDRIAALSRELEDQRQRQQLDLLDVQVVGTHHRL